MSRKAAKTQRKLKKNYISILAPTVLRGSDTTDEGSHAERGNEHGNVLMMCFVEGKTEE
jgi:hypothetical protein